MIYSGFYDSVNGDRKYKGEQFGMIFDGIITDGIVYGWPSKDEALKVSVKDAASRTVELSKGRAWFEHTWILNDFPIVLTIDPLDLPDTTGRIDAVYLTVNKKTEVRASDVLIKKGEPGEYMGGVLNAAKPSVASEDEDIVNKTLAYVKVECENGVYKLEVMDARGTVETPWVSYHMMIDDKSQEAFAAYFGNHFIWDEGHKILTIVP